MDSRNEFKAKFVKAHNSIEIVKKNIIVPLCITHSYGSVHVAERMDC